MKCQYCGKEQKDLQPENITGLWVCDYCYSNTLNPYVNDGDIIKRADEIERLGDYK